MKCVISIHSNPRPEAPDLTGAPNPGAPTDEARSHHGDYRRALAETRERGGA